MPASTPTSLPPSCSGRCSLAFSFRDDTLRYNLASFAIKPLEQMLVALNRRLKRNKAFKLGRLQGRMVAALDGIEILCKLRPLL